MATDNKLEIQVVVNTQEALQNLEDTTSSVQELGETAVATGHQDFSKVTRSVSLLNQEFQKTLDAIKQLQKVIVVLPPIDPQLRQEVVAAVNAIQEIGIEVNGASREINEFTESSKKRFSLLKISISSTFFSLKSGVSLALTVIRPFIKENQELVRSLTKTGLSAAILTVQLIRLFGATTLVRTGMNTFAKIGGISGLSAIKDAVIGSINLFQYFSQVFGNVVNIVKRFSSIILLTAGAIAASVIKVVANVQEVNTRIKGLSSSAAEYSDIQTYLGSTATKLSSDIITLSNSYTRLLNLEKSGIITTDESRQMLEGFSNLAMKTGATSDQLGTAMYGLAQGLSAGVLRAEEFNQVMEPLPGLLQEMDKASGVGSGGFRKLVNDGKITSEMFKNTLIVALASYEGAAAQTAGNIVPTFTRMKNTLINLQASFERPVTNSLVPLMNGMSSIFAGFKQGVDNSIRQGDGFLQFIVELSTRIGVYLTKIGAIIPQAIGMIDFSDLIEQVNGIINVLAELTGEESFAGLTVGIDLTKPEGLAKILQTIINLTSTGIMVFKEYLSGFSGIIVGLRGTAEITDNFSGIYSILLGVGAKIQGIIDSIQMFGQVITPIVQVLGIGVFMGAIAVLNSYFATFQHGAKIMFIVKIALSALFPVASLFASALSGINIIFKTLIWGNLVKVFPILGTLATLVMNQVKVWLLWARSMSLSSVLSGLQVAMSATYHFIIQRIAALIVGFQGLIVQVGLLRVALGVGVAALVGYKIGEWAVENIGPVTALKDAISGLFDKVLGYENTGTADEQMTTMIENLRQKTNDTSITVDNYREKLRTYYEAEEKAARVKEETAKKSEKLKQSYANLTLQVKESVEDIKEMYQTLSEMTRSSFEMRFSLISEGDPNAIQDAIALEQEKFLSMQALIQRDEDKRMMAIDSQVRLEQEKVQRLKEIESEMIDYKAKIEEDKVRAAQASGLYEINLSQLKGKELSESEQKVLSIQKNHATKATQLVAERENKIKSLEQERGNILAEKAKRDAESEKQIKALTEETLMSRIQLTRQTLAQALQTYQQYAQKVKQLESGITEEKKRQSDVIKGLDESANSATKDRLNNQFKESIQAGNIGKAREIADRLALKSAQELANRRAEYAEMTSQIEQAMRDKDFAKAVEIAKAQESLGIKLAQDEQAATELSIQRQVELGQISQENADMQMESVAAMAQSQGKNLALEAQERINAAMTEEKAIAQANADTQLGFVEQLNTSFKSLLEEFAKSKEGTALDVRFIPDTKEIDAFIAQMKGEKVEVPVDVIGVSQGEQGMSFVGLKDEQQQEGLMNVNLKPVPAELEAYLQAKQEQGLNVKLMPDSAQVDSLIQRLKEPTSSTHTITVIKEGVTAATGGLIRGPGTTTSDSIPAWLSDREYVIPAKSVDYFGVNFFHALRNLQFPRMGYATGGLATAAGPQTFFNQTTVNNSRGNEDLKPIEVNVGHSKIPLYGRTESAKALREALRDLKRG